MDMFLAHPAMDLKKKYIDFYQEWKESREEMIPFVIKRNPEDFQSMLDYLSNCEKGTEPPENWIPESSTYWLIDNNEMIGVVNIRHRLTEPLFKAGGHIGYGIRPSKRKNGYATQILSLALEKSKELNLEKVLLVCNSTNAPSKKVILNNGGISDKDFIDEQNNILKRYWIELK
ncbi:GNAT family N-acetyltransferase [Lentibacillus sp. CBA3610]|uniref:GNAT family N-acetyltransferase n=1 Tax=Lentibacillus sp. CBA3610 TaxID=2518176 RepID=UPI00159601CD|nr:GNAT family N-acetyltransferase [Lentibacillus sp. CBA3610]QKY70596.1 GNAT family N-acetyltransferase [Lentibacillus sp. CBA3610]